MSKVKMIVDAVNYFRGNNQKWQDDGARKDDELLILRATKDYRVAGVQRYKGKLITGGIGFNDECCELICTKNEFNKCVKEMSLHNVKQEQLDAYVAADKEVLKPVFDEWENGDECVYNGNGNCFVIGWLPSSPLIVIETNEMDIKCALLMELSKPETPQQKAARERELAKAKQVDDYFLSLNENGETVSKYKIGVMQELGMLAEIITPLEIK